MKFLDWQIDRIKGRLNTYRSRAGTNGRMRPWKGVLYDILTHPDTSHVFPEDGSHPEFKEEALRRFANGMSIPTPDKIEDIRIFLAKRGFLKKNDLEDDPDDIDEVLSLHSYLASRESEARDYLAALPLYYEAERVGDGMKELFRLRLKQDHSGDFLWVDDVYERVVDKDFKHADLEARDGFQSCQQRRRGFGFICTNQNILYIFTHAPKRKDFMSYTQIALYAPSKETETLRFMVSGSKVPIHHVPLLYKEGDKDKLVNFNTLDFAQPSHEAFMEELMNEYR